MMMKWHIFAAIILILLKSFHCNTIELSSYSKVIKNGFPSTTAASISISSTATEQQEHTKPHSREGVTTSELWFPKIFDVNNKTSESTGRSVDANRPFPFPLKDFHFPTINSRPSNHRFSHHEPRIIYAAPPVSQIAQDRFVPRESVDHFIDKNNRNRVKFSPVLKESDREGDGLSTSSQQDVGPVYTPPKDTYAFPPNKDSVYSAPDIRKPISVSSYLPPPSGPSPYPIYAGPTNPNNISPLNTQTDAGTNGDGTNSDANDDKMQSDDDNDSNSDRPSDDMKLIDKPSSDFMPSKKPSMPSFPFLDNSDSSNDDSVDDHAHHHNHDHNHHDDHSFIDSNYPIEIDSFKHLHGFDAYPEIILDHDPHNFYDDDHHHHFHHPLPPPTTTQAPLPPPPPEEPEEPEMQPRVKKFSYFYLSRSLWYIPLYFTVYFVFYVTWLILQSIGRHEVSLPNHTKSRRSIPNYSHRESVEKINLLTEFVMSQIEDFKEKYLLL